jgi:hypothetical protein
MRFLVLFASMSLSDLPQDAESATAIPPLKVKSLEECEELSECHPLEFCDYVQELGKQNNLAALEQLCEAGFGYARTVYIETLDAKAAVRYCMRFPAGSSQWVYASWGLDAHQKSAVIGYIKDVCRKGDGPVRAECYSLCLKAGWDDLLESAKRDVDDMTPMSDAIGRTVGSRARQYIKVLPLIQQAKRSSQSCSASTPGSPE